MIFKALLVIFMLVTHILGYDLQTYHVLKEPCDERHDMLLIHDVDDIRLQFEEAAEELGDRYIKEPMFSWFDKFEEYNRINNGTNPTKAVLMLSRTMTTYGYTVFPDQNVPNSKTAEFAIGYSTDHSIALDCDMVSGEDRDLCLSALKTPVGKAKCFSNFPMSSGKQAKDNRNAIYHILPRPGEKLILEDDFTGLNATSEVFSYIDAYNRTNDGTNPTKALIMRCRLYEISASSYLNRDRPIGLVEATQRNSMNDTGAIYGAIYIAEYSITLDCDLVSGPDYELCESIQKIPLFYLCLKSQLYGSSVF